MKYFFTSFLFFYFSFCFSQLTEKGNEFIVNMIKKNDIDKLILENKDFEFIKKICSGDEYYENSSSWGFTKLEKLVINIGYKNNNYIITEKVDKNSVVYSHETLGENRYVYNDKIVILLKDDYNKNFTKSNKNLVLCSKKKYIDEKKILLNLINKRLEGLNKKNNLENSFLIGDIYDALYKGLLNESLKEISFKRNNTIDYNIESELKRLNFKFIKRKHEWSDIKDWWYLYDESEFEIANLENKKREDEEKERKDLEFKKNNPSGFVKNYVKNGSNYTGSLINGIYEGKGILQTTQNDKSVSFDGDFKNGLYEGFGKLKISKWTYSGSFSQEDYNESYEGEFKNGVFEGKGKHSIYNRETSRKSHYVYDGEFKNGKFDGKGKIIYNPTSHDDSWSYDGEWKDGKFDGFGVIKRYDKTSVESFKLASNKEFRGNFSNGKKNGEFIVNGLYQGKADYKFSYKIIYNNDVEVSKTIIFDQINERNNEIEEANYAYQSKINAENKANCEKCNIDWKNSKSPKDDYTLWVKTGRKSGVIMMANGDSYNFDYENGKCKVTNGWFQSDDYYSTFDIMIENLLKKCKQNYCK